MIFKMVSKKVFLVWSYLGLVLISSKETSVGILGLLGVTSVARLLVSVTESAVQEYKEKLTTANKNSWV